MTEIKTGQKKPCQNSQTFQMRQALYKGDLFHEAWSLSGRQNQTNAKTRMFSHKYVICEKGTIIQGVLPEDCKDPTN